MDSPSGNSSQIHGDEDLVDERKRKRMQSNRESAQRSRMRKQKHLDDQMAEIERLKKDNRQILTAMEVTRQKLSEIEGDNSVLRAHMGELSQRLDSLNEIVNCTSGMFGFEFELEQPDLFNHPWNMNMMQLNRHPIMASATDVFQY